MCRFSQKGQLAERLLHVAKQSCSKRKGRFQEIFAMIFNALRAHCVLPSEQLIYRVIIYKGNIL